MARVRTYLIEDLEVRNIAKVKADGSKNAHSIGEKVVKKTGLNSNKEERGTSDVLYVIGTDAEDEDVDIDISPEEFGKDITFFLSLDPKKAAWDLTMTEWNLFKNITTEDIQVHGTGISFAINMIIQNHEMVYYWTLETVLSGENPKVRGKIITQLIRIADYLVNNNNFNSSHAIISALQTYSIQRLDKSWKKLTSNKMKMLKNLTDLFSEKDNFYKLTQKMDDVNDVDNISVPYLDLFLVDFQASMQLDIDERVDTLRRVGIVVEDIGKISKIRQEGNSKTLVRSQLIHSMKVSQEKLRFLHAESTNRSFRLEPPKRYLFSVLDLRKKN